MVRAVKKNFSGLTIVELLICFVLLSVVVVLSFRVFGSFASGRSEGLSRRLRLQIEARRALVSVHSILQDGIELIKPDPGTTLPFLVFRDYVNNIHFLYLTKDEQASQDTGQDIFRLLASVYEIETEQFHGPREVLSQIDRLSFTAHGYSSVLVSCTLRERNSSFSLVNLIRLKNAGAREGG